MRLLVGCAVGWSLVFCLAARAEEPLHPAPGLAAALPPPGIDHAVPEGVDPLGSVSAHLLLGQQLGFRAQVAVARRENCTFVAEGFYGALLTRFDASEGAGGGARALFRRTSQDGHDSLHLGPGVNLLYQFEHDGLLILAPSVDISWLHGFGGGGGWEIGLNAGFGVSLMDGGDHDDTQAGDVTPIISVYTGFRF